MTAASRARMLLLPAAIALLAACAGGRTEQLENELMLMQERMVELESLLADAQEHAQRLSPAVAQLEAYVGDVEKEVIDLSATVSRDLLVNTEANLGNVKTKLAEVRERTALLNRTLQTEE